MAHQQSPKSYTLSTSQRGVTVSISWSAETLFEVLRSQQLNERRRALLLLADTPDEALLEPLVHASRDEDSGVRRLAVERLAELAHPDALPALMRALDDASEQVRSTAKLALSELRGAALEQARKLRWAVAAEQ